MIVPAHRLIFWVAMLGIPLAVLAAIAPQTAPLLVLAGVGFAAIVLVDASMASRAAKGIAIELPEVVRLQKGRPGDLEVVVRNDARARSHLRVGLAFPPAITAAHDELEVSLPAGTERSRFKWACTPHVRGRYQLDGCFLETQSPLGLWSWRGRLPGRSELRVYPNLFEERKNVAALFLNRGHFGMHAQRQSGRGREFEKLRDYVVGDSFDEIHWKATARRRRPVTKVFQIERTQEIYVVVDGSRLMAREDALERYVAAALMLGVAAEQQGDLFGLLTFDDKIRSFVRAKSGTAHFDACRDTLYTMQPRLVSPDFDELGIFLRTRLRKRALVVILTALDDPVLAESFTRNAELICRQHLVVVNMLRPEGTRSLFTDSKVETVDDVYRHLSGHLIWRNLRELEKRLQQRGIRFGLLDHEKLSAQLVSQYLEIKSRQLL